jgi:Ice-binding-like/PEP-CTERM motif
MRLRILCLLVLPLMMLSVLATNAYADACGAGNQCLSNLAADNFAVLGAQTVTNTGATTLGGNLGLQPGSSITGTGTITLSGVTDISNSLSMAGQNDATGAVTDLHAMAPTMDLTGQDLGGKLLGVGVYTFSSSAQLTGALTLNFTGADQSIVFLIGSTLTTGSASSVLITGAFAGDQVYWVVGSSATLGTTTSFAGDIIAADSVTMNTGATDGCGSVIGQTAAVTLQGNTISTGCNINTTGTGGTPIGTVTPTPVTGGTIVTVPEPSSFALLSSGLLAMVFLTFRKSLVSSLS